MAHRNTNTLSHQSGKGAWSGSVGHACHDGCDTHHVIGQSVISNATQDMLHVYVVKCGLFPWKKVQGCMWPCKSAMSENRSDHGWSGCYGLEAYNYTHTKTRTQKLQVHTHTNYNHKISTCTTTLTWTTTTQGHILYMQQRNASLYNIMTDNHKILCNII